MHRDLRKRLGFLPKNLSLDKPIWLHAVSVGEAIAIKGLVEQIRNIFPQKKLVITTVTPTGNKIAKSIAEENDFVGYLPLDLSFIVKRVIRKIDPSMVVIAETEIWPNFIRFLKKQRVPVIVVNGRISDKSYQGYQRIKFFMKKVFNLVDMFCVQTTVDAKRLEDLGVSPEKIKVTGNMKFDLNGISEAKINLKDYRDKLALAENEMLFIAASTHAQEEEIILEVYKKLLLEFKDLRLLLAPRHPERSKEVGELVKKYGFENFYLSGAQPKANSPQPTAQRNVFILDSIGQLMNYYAIADIVFVGGSLIEKGGHNILEPAALSKPIIFGPYMHNFREITGLFLENSACMQINNAQELFQAVKDLLNDPAKRQALGDAGNKIILANQGATKRNLECIKEIASSSSAFGETPPRNDVIASRA